MVATRWLHRWAVLAGWAVGMGWGTYIAYGVPLAADPSSHFGGPLAVVPGTSTKFYIGLMALILNLLVAVIGTAVLRAAKVPDGNDETRSTDYVADAGDPRVADEIDPHAPAHA